MGHGRTQITLQGGKCQKMNEKHQMACQIYLFTLFSHSQATFDHNTFWASTFPLLRYPWALSTPSQTLWCAHDHGLQHAQETSQASRGAVGGCVGKKNISKQLQRGWLEGGLGGSLLPIFKGEGRRLGAVAEGRWMSSSGGVRKSQLWGSKHVQSTSKP